MRWNIYHLLTSFSWLLFGSTCESKSNITYEWKIYKSLITKKQKENLFNLVYDSALRVFNLFSLEFHRDKMIIKLSMTALFCAKWNKKLAHVSWTWGYLSAGLINASLNFVSSYLAEWNERLVWALHFFPRILDKLRSASWSSMCEYNFLRIKKAAPPEVLLSYRWRYRRLESADELAETGRDAISLFWSCSLRRSNFR